MDSVRWLNPDPLLAACLAGDREAWDRFVRRHGPFVQAEARRQLLRYLGRAGAADVEDAAQEVFALLLRDDARALRQFRGQASITTWLGRVVRSVCRQIAGRARAPAPAAEPVFEPPPEESVPARAVEEAILALPPRDQKLLRLFFYEGRKYREIAAELGLSVNSVGPLLARALETLSGRLGPSKDSP